MIYLIKYIANFLLKILKTKYIKNYYGTDFEKTVLISYIITQFRKQNNFMHQNYLTSHIIAESFNELGFNVDIVDYDNEFTKIDYNKYDVVFGFGEPLENAFLTDNQAKKIFLVTGAHRYLQNTNCIKALNDFKELSELWRPSDSQVLNMYWPFSHECSDMVFILAAGYIKQDFASRFFGRLFTLNNTILGTFLNFEKKSIQNRNKNFLFLAGGKPINKGLSFICEIAKIRRDLSFIIVLRSLSKDLEDYYHDILYNSSNVEFYKNIPMNSDAMKNIIKRSTYVVLPSYSDGMPGSIIEPMSCGIIPIVSKYCGFPNKDFIFEIDELNLSSINSKIDEVINLSDNQYLDFSHKCKDYILEEYSYEYVKKQLKTILAKEI